MQRRGPSTIRFADGPPLHRDATGRIDLRIRALL